MEPDHILQADLLDIIFEKKNKNYGAYPLRKYYQERVYRALGIIFVASIIIAIPAYFYKIKKSSVIVAIPDPMISKLFELPKEIPKTPEPPHPLAKTITSAVSNIQPALQKPTIGQANSGRIVFSAEAPKIELPSSPGTNVVPMHGPVIDEIPKSFPITGNNLSKAIDKSIPLNTADVLPSFPGGMAALRSFLEKNLVNPQDIDAGETISVRIKFIVGYDGLIKGYEITEDGGAPFNNEVLRVLKKMPAWIPGKSHGENVSVFYSIPVKFTSAG